MATLVVGGALTAAGSGYGLFSYNRQNFMFNGEMLLKREYQGQSMRLKRFSLYREDIHDLIDLTVGKMDTYMITNTILLSMAFILFTEGKPDNHVWPQRIHWLYTLCIAGSIVYFVLSMWLSMHASISAHSHGVRLLTQFVRLPVPTRQQLDDARVQALDWERSSARQFLRVPVLGQQFNANLGQHAPHLASRLNDAVGNNEGEDNSQRVVDPDEDVLTPTAQLRHVRTFREVQKNWIAFDAYSRVCMTMGTNQMVHGVCYYMLGALTVENNNPFVGLPVALVLCVATWLIIKLDVYASRRKFFIAGLLFLVAPILETLAVTITTWKDAPQAAIEFANLLGAPVFLTHLLWLMFMVQLCRSEEHNDMALPVNFRSVTYVDVFGWFREDEDAAAEPAATDAESRQRPPAGEEESTAPSPEMVVLMHGEIQRLCTALQVDIKRWSSNGVKQMLSQETLATVERFRQRLSSAEEVLQKYPQGNMQTETINRPARDDTKVWLRIAWQGAAEYYYCTETDECQWTDPETDYVSDVVMLHAGLSSLEYKVQAYRDARERMLGGAAAREKVATVARHVQRQRSPLLRTGTAREDSFSSAATSAFDVLDHELTGTLGSNTNVQLTPPQIASPDQAGSIIPLDDSRDRPRHSRTFTHAHSPGMVPSRTFTQASYALQAAWVLGTLWNTFDWGENVIPKRHNQTFPEDQCGNLCEQERQTENSHPEQAGGIAQALSTLLQVDGHWPHVHFHPTGLACHPAAGTVAMVASKYAVHELDLNAFPAFHTRPALVECLAADPDFHARGIQDISLDCPSSASPGSIDCDVLLLSSAGDRILRCNLAEGRLKGPQMLLPGNHHWNSLAVGAQSSVWALGQDVLLELSPSSRKNDTVMLWPRSEIHAAGASATTKLHVLAEGSEKGGTVMALDAGGRLKAWQPGAEAPILQVLSGSSSKTKRWAGLCSTMDYLWFITEGEDYAPAALWRLHERPSPHR